MCPLYPPYVFLPASVVQRQTRVDAPSRLVTNQMSAWPSPKGISVPLSIYGEVSLVTLYWLPQSCPSPYEDHDWIARQNHLNSIAFQPWSHKLNPEVRTNHAAHSHTHSHQRYYSFPSLLLGMSLTCRTPLGNSQELIKLQFHPVGQELTEGWLSWGWAGLTKSGWNCQESFTFLLGVQSGQDYSEGWNSGAK
jgi:hypothetical protein